MPAPALARLAKIDRDLDSAPPPFASDRWPGDRRLVATPAELASFALGRLATFDRLAVTLWGAPWAIRRQPACWQI